MYDMGYWLRGVSQAKIESQSNVGVRVKYVGRQTRFSESSSAPVPSKRD